MKYTKYKLNTIFVFICLVINLLLLTGCFTGCKATPENETVISHDAQEFQEAIMQAEDAPEAREIPTNYNDSFVSKDNMISITIDAKVIIPEQRNLPVIKIELSPISDEKIQWAVDEFLEGDEGAYPLAIMTKTELDAWIVFFQSMLANEEELYMKYKTEEAVNKAKNNLEESIEKCKEMYKDATEENIQIPSNLMFRPIEFYKSTDVEIVENELNMTEKLLVNRRNSQDVNLYLSTDVQISDGKYVRFTIYDEFPYSATNTKGIFGVEHHQIHVVYSYIPLTIESTFVLKYNPFSCYIPTIGSLDSSYPELFISEQEAIEMAKDKLESLEINNFYVSNVREVMGMEYIEEYHNYCLDENNTMSKKEYFEDRNPNKFYLITMSPIYYGIPLLEAQQSFSNEALYNMPIESEKIILRVSEDSIAEFKWTNPTDVSNVINDNAKIISFETAIENAKNFMQVKYIMPTVAPIIPEMEDYEEILAEYKEGNINIKEIKLGLATVPTADSSEGYLLIPVWNFYGSYSLSSSLDEYSFEPVDLDYPLVSVNAIDGSIISQSVRLPH